MVELFLREVSATLGKINDDDILAQGNAVRNVAFARSFAIRQSTITARGVIARRAIVTAGRVTADRGSSARAVVVCQSGTSDRCGVVLCGGGPPFGGAVTWRAAVPRFEAVH